MQSDQSNRSVTPRAVKAELAGKRILVVGMARSGLAVATALADQGAHLFVSDAAPRASLTEAVGILSERQIAYECGGHTLDALAKTDLVVTSPGVPPDNVLLQRAAERNIPVVAEIEIAYRLSEAPILATTGSNGKTTTTSWIASIYHAAGRKAEVGGNIGRPYAEFAAVLPSSARAILEVSTFQLEHVVTFCPKIAVLLNLSPDHIDRHGSFNEYVRLKFRLFENQQPEHVAVFNADDPVIGDWNTRRPSGRAARWWFSAHGPVVPGVWLSGDSLAFDTGTMRGVVPGSDRLVPPGEHNRMNAAAAVAMALADGLAPDEIGPGLTAFRGVEHRLEFVTRTAGITFVNDSKATNPDSVAKAVAAMKAPLIVIMGGRDKGTDFQVLAGDLKAKARAVIFTGTAAGRLQDQLGTAVAHDVVPDFTEAFYAAVKRAKPGDTILLAPGCASFDQFENYEHRGRVFKGLVQEFALRQESN